MLTTEDRTALGDRIGAMLGRRIVARGLSGNPYYNSGVRFQITARSSEGIDTPLVDGGAFDWVAKLTSNRRAVFVASGLGSQLVPVMFRRLTGPR